VRVEEPSAAERSVARRVAEARATVPHLELVAEVDMRQVLARYGERAGSTTAILVRACALALREYPRANGAYRDGRFELYSRVNVGVVVAFEAGYLIPTLFDADNKTPEELSVELEQMASDTRAGRLAAPGYSGATFTLWDAGPHGVTSASIPTVPPQAAALTAGAVRRHQALTLTLTCDHRILYGVQATAFLRAVRARLERSDL
jgi:pyruvate dehydrogenase E2 component (dihydrolipoamide acetyltransferase)